MSEPQWIGPGSYLRQHFLHRWGAGRWLVVLAALVLGVIVGMLLQQQWG